mmetsp:Transcript_1549/g.5329  ORF Transcript_1549/g.5329 Transcript_1549/m.5329 type:complete len:80 (-) Transcript_1549:72-311(-)|eukprot:CAMPEP_0117448880 /NCGR_PEP_ID=MMETSP0759-20121206/7640_1 /TAXON_ID=63605 /ORGANISM="Percolomonas cosmopolitus, Strain WS" /LENGTH=79 /DNA_ID=CAMNT_0005241303 /DNA_START=55 /DNA_END=294 /DNA_ORIENTATION=-
MPQQKIRWKECLNDAAISFAMGAMVGGAMAMGGCALYALHPSLRGNRMRFVLFQGSKITLQGGAAFGSLLGVGGYLRCL